jgi:predicted TIM-barrel fold metal-dependent hydrolase
MKKLMNQFPDNLKGFVAYNPKREKGLDLVINALNEGFTGIKFYPPLGYNPVNSKELFKYCADKGIPVFTHCTPSGFEAGENYGLNSDPKNWEKVLIEVNDLKLCLGHAGGVKGWFGPFDPNNIFPNDTYAKDVVKLCTKYKNVYAEVGFLDHIEKPMQRDQFVKRLQHLFKDKTANYNFKDKIMYGSDWHVLLNHPKKLYKNYLKEFIKLLNRKEFIEFKNLKAQFFYLNAENFLKPKKDENENIAIIT